VGKDARNHLLLYLNLGYALLIVYASLYPLTGWRDSGSNPLDFLAAAWPRYLHAFDLATNVLAYLPFGFLCAATLRLRPAAAAGRPAGGGARRQHSASDWS
jgi:VanZ family protein